MPERDPTDGPPTVGTPSAPSPPAGGSTVDATQAQAAHATALSGADAALVAAVADDEEAPFDLEALAAEAGAGRALLDAITRAGLLLPHHVDADGVARFSRADVTAVRAGLALVEAGLPLGELLALGRRTDEAVAALADHAVEAFLRFVRDPVRGAIDDEAEAAERLVTAYRVMLPATERLVAHHTRRRLLAAAAGRVAADAAADTGDATGADVDEHLDGGAGDGPGGATAPDHGDAR